MSHYVVTWDIDIEAESAQEAAKIALEIQRKPTSEAVFFQVEDTDGNRELVDFLENVGEAEL